MSNSLDNSGNKSKLFSILILAVFLLISFITVYFFNRGVTSASALEINYDDDGVFKVVSSSIDDYFEFSDLLSVSGYGFTLSGVRNAYCLVKGSGLFTCLVSSRDDSVSRSFSFECFNDDTYLILQSPFTYDSSSSLCNFYILRLEMVNNFTDSGSSVEFMYSANGCTRIQAQSSDVKSSLVYTNTIDDLSFYYTNSIHITGDDLSIIGYSTSSISAVIYYDYRLSLIIDFFNVQDNKTETRRFYLTERVQTGYRDTVLYSRDVDFGNYKAGYNHGYFYGYDVGVIAGKADAHEDTLTDITADSFMINLVNSFMSIELFPNVRLSYLLYFGFGIMLLIVVTQFLR